MAAANAARSPPRSSAARPRAVVPPGEVTSRRSRSVSCSRARSSSALPAIVSVTSRCAIGAGMPRRIAASTHASATSAQ